MSANPTGPLHVGNARGAFVGDLLCRVLEAGGQRVTREYYFNDVGGQIPNLGASIAAHPARRAGARGRLPRRLRRGPRGRASPTTSGPTRRRPAPTPPAILGHWAAGRVREGIEASLARLGVRFDVWTTEASLHDEGWVERAIERLREGGHVYEQDGALWFRSTAFGDDKDRVIIRSNGEPTYFAADIGYVTEKFSRGFDHLIYIWGADHHGTVARVRNAAEAMGYDPDAVQMLLYSWVRFVRDGVEVSMSKRAGEFITLDELLAEVGVDAARWFFASRAVDTGDRLRHRAGQEAVEREPGLLRPVRPRPDRVDPAQGGRCRPRAGAGRRGPARRARPRRRWPGPSPGSPRSSRTRSRPRRRTGITAYATELATTFHAFYRDARVVDPEAAGPLRGAAGARRGGAGPRSPNALGLLGISAPESM